MEDILEMKGKLKEGDREILKKLNETILGVDKALEKFRFAQAAEEIYHFMWDEVADKYIEEVKKREDKDVALSVLRYVMINGIKLLHPFMPFVTEAVWEQIEKEEKDPLMVASWPSTR